MMWGLTSIVQHTPYQHICFYCNELINDGLTRITQTKGSSFHLNAECCHKATFDECRIYTDGCEFFEDHEYDVEPDLDNSCKEVYTFFSIDDFHIAYMCCRKCAVRVSTSNNPAADIEPAGNDNALDASH